MALTWVGVPGLEPGTSSLSGKRSNRLSYTPKGSAARNLVPEGTRGSRTGGDCDTLPHPGEQSHRRDRGVRACPSPLAGIARPVSCATPVILPGDRDRGSLREQWPPRSWRIRVRTMIPKVLHAYGVRNLRQQTSLR